MKNLKGEKNEHIMMCFDCDTSSIYDKDTNSLNNLPSLIHTHFVRCQAWDSVYPTPLPSLLSVIISSDGALWY